MMLRWVLDGKKPVITAGMLCEQFHLAKLEVALAWLHTLERQGFLRLLPNRDRRHRYAWQPVLNIVPVPSTDHAASCGVQDATTTSSQIGNSQ